MSVRSSDAIVQLAHYLYAGHVPLAWVVANAPDGDLAHAWNATASPHAMLRVLQYHDGLVAALAALAPWTIHSARFDLGALPNLLFDDGPYTTAWVRSGGRLSAMGAVHAEMTSAIRRAVQAPNLRDVLR